MRLGGPHAHSAGGKGYPQTLAYYSQHPIPWQGTIPGHPPQCPPGEGTTAPALAPPWSWAGREGVKDLLTRTIVLDTIQRKRMLGPKFLQLPLDRWTELDK